MPDCQSCKEKKQAVEPVPYIVHESAMARQERTIKRLWILLIILICLLMATNGAWIAYEAQFTDEIITVESNTDDGGTAIANASGEVTYYGESESDG